MLRLGILAVARYWPTSSDMVVHARFIYLRLGQIIRLSPSYSESSISPSILAGIVPKWIKVVY